MVSNPRNQFKNFTLNDSLPCYDDSNVVSGAQLVCRSAAAACVFHVFLERDDPRENINRQDQSRIRHALLLCLSYYIFTRTKLKHLKRNRGLS